MKTPWLGSISLAAALSLVIPGCAQAVVFWTTTWDEDPAVISREPDGWWDDSCGGAAWPTVSNPGISNLKAFSGTKSLRHHFAGHAGGCFVDRVFPATEEVWFTYWEFMDPGFQIDATGTKALKPGDNFGSHWWVYMWGSRQLSFACQACKDAAEGAYGTETYYQNMTAFAMPDNKWVCYELHLKYNTPGQKNAVYEGFATPYGGQTVQFAGYYNREWRGASTTDPLPSQSKFALMREYVQSGTGELYRDDHTVSTTRVGCGNGVPPPPPPPPAPVPPPPAPVPPPATAPATVSDLAAAPKGSGGMVLTFTEVSDGLGQPANYEIRYAAGPINWGSATAAGQGGTCASPVAGAAVGAVRTCTVAGLSASTQYQFQVVAFRGTPNVDAVFGSLSNIAAASTTAGASSTDVNGDGSTNVTDVQLGINQALGGVACSTGDVNRDGACNVTDVQLIINKALGL